MDGEPMVDGMTEESFREFYDLMRAGGVAKTSQLTPASSPSSGVPSRRRAWTCCTYPSRSPYPAAATTRGARGAAHGGVPGLEVPRRRLHERLRRLRAHSHARRREPRPRARPSRRTPRTSRPCTTRCRPSSRRNDLTYLYRGGRVSRTSAAFGTALKIVPIMHLDYEGHLEVLAEGARR